MHCLRWAYLACAVLACFCMAGPTVLMELGGIPLAVGFAIAFYGYWRCLRGAFEQPLMILLGVWALWIVSSWLWTPRAANDAWPPDKGVWELGTLRFFWLIVVLWPAMTHRRLLIASLAAGFLATNASQVLVALARHFGWSALDLAAKYPDRNAGWWSHPAVSGYMFVAAIGLHLPAAVMGRGRPAWIARACTAATWVGIMATGTRGAMVSSAVLTGIALCVGGVVRIGTMERPRRGRWVAGALTGLLVLGGLLGVVAMTTRAGDRIREGIDEVSRAVNQRDFSTFTGSRVQHALWAWEIWRDHPVRGVGAGGYESTVRALLAARGEVARTPDIKPDAHNMFLHAAATLGAVGVVILIAICFFALRGGLKGLTRESLGSYDAGPAFALLGMLLVTPFDVLYVHSAPSALLAVLFAMCLMGRPSPVPGFGTAALREYLSRR